MSNIYSSVCVFKSKKEKEKNQKELSFRVFYKQYALSAPTLHLATMTIQVFNTVFFLHLHFNSKKKTMSEMKRKRFNRM